jgi:uncharacterized protein
VKETIMSSQTNKQLVMQAYQLFRNDDIQGLLALFADDIEWHGAESELIPFSGIYCGTEQVASFFSELAQAQDVIRFEPQTFIAEGEMVAVTGQSSWRVKSTGQKYDNPWAHVFTVRDGKVVRFEQYNDTAATEAAYRPVLTGSQQQETPLRH